MFSKLVFGDFIYKVNISNINCLFFLFSYVKLFDNCAKFFKLIPFFFFCILIDGGEEVARASLPRSRLNCILPERRERERERVFERALEKSSVSRLWTRYTATPLPQECRRAGPSRVMPIRCVCTRASSSSSFVCLSSPPLL